MTATASITIEPAPLAARLRIRKGQVVRLTGWDGSAKVYRVTGVSMPDASGRCVVSIEPAE